MSLRLVVPLLGLASAGLIWAAPDAATVLFLGAGSMLGVIGALALHGRPFRTPAPATHVLAAGPVAGMPDPLVVLDALHDPVIVLTGRGNVTFANQAARTAYPSLQTDQPMSFALRDPALLAEVNRVIAEGGEGRVEVIERGLVERSFDCRIVALNGPVPRQRNAAVVLVSLADLTSQRALETMRVDFIANASHELRTPLASILGFTETLQGPARNDPAARERFLAIMATQARRMARLVDDLLSLSRIELKEHQQPTGLVDLSALAAEAVSALTELARERGVILHLDRPAGAFEVNGERDELLSVLDNLIENAIKYGKSGQKVDISVGDGANPDEVAVSVRDYGAGIDAVHLPRLTERFYRIDNAMSRAEGGTGLGLALVKHTLNRHRGRLMIESSPGKGATFRVVLHRRAAGIRPVGSSL